MRQPCISVGFSEKHNGEFFEDTLEKVMEMFGKVRLVVDDSIQWRTLKLKFPSFDDELLKKIAIQEGDNWFEENNIEALKQQYGDRLEVIRWKDFPEKEVEKSAQEMRKLYNRFIWENWTVASIKEHLELTSGPSRDIIYVEHKEGKLWYFTKIQALKEDKGSAAKKQLTEEQQKEKLPKRELIFDMDNLPVGLDRSCPLFDPNQSLSWNELRPYLPFIPPLVNPIKLGIDLTAEEFLARKKKQAGSISPHVPEETAKSLVIDYLIEECAAMANPSLWPPSDFEVYPGRTAAMAVTHYCLIKPAYPDREYVLDSVSITGNESNSVRDNSIGFARLIQLFHPNEQDETSSIDSKDRPKETRDAGQLCR